MSDVSNILKRDLERLLEMTDGCRDDMHEPDEQDLKASVFGDHLDNACADRVTIDSGYQEYIVVLKRGGRMQKFNLANLIALARMATVPENL